MTIHILETSPFRLLLLLDDSRHQIGLAVDVHKVGDSKFLPPLSTRAECYRALTTVIATMTESQFCHQGMVPSMIIH